MKNNKSEFIIVRVTKKEKQSLVSRSTEAGRKKLSDYVRFLLGF